MGGWFGRRLLAIMALWLGIGTAFAADAPVRVGLLAESQPFHTWPANGRPRGFDVDLLDRLARDTGLRFEYVRYERWDTLLADLATGKVQLVTATARTADREIWMGFTRMYASAAQGFAGRRSETSVTTQPDLAGRRLALVRSFATEAIASERFSLADKRLYDSNAQALDAVERGEADYVLGTAGGLRALLAERPGTALTVLRALSVEVRPLDRTLGWLCSTLAAAAGCGMLATGGDLGELGPGGPVTIVGALLGLVSRLGSAEGAFVCQAPSSSGSLADLLSHGRLQDALRPACPSWMPILADPRRRHASITGFSACSFSSE